MVLHGAYVVTEHTPKKKKKKKQNNKKKKKRAAKLPVMT